MANVDAGMNIQEVRDLAKLLDTKAGELDTIITTLQNKIQGTSWVGKDANDFKGPWWAGHKKSLKKTADDLRGFAQSAKNNATEQEKVSGH